MRLRRVKIFGFKTFADRTEFALEGDMVAVVGSNGCGKSNLVDAILWGLGEGNPRQLRAGTGTDVIFSGSARRKAVGYAEVTLTFDNEDGALPVDSAEVSISRKLTRDGESEYSINRANCRLRDIHELLADSGLGRAGYAIVGQKDIDSALSASPEQRRNWIDEAAGVQRFRLRKAEAERRLRSADEHIVRVDDILGELEGQREPLRIEAEVARRYKAVYEALRSLEVGWLRNESLKAMDELAAAEGDAQKAVLAIGECSRELTGLEEELDQAGTVISATEAESDRERSDFQALLGELEGTRTDAKIAEQRIANIDEIERTLEEQADKDAERIQEAAEEFAAASRSLIEDERALEELRKSGESASDEQRQASQTLRELDVKIARAREIEQVRVRADAAHQQREERSRLIRREIRGIAEGEPDLVASLKEALAARDSAKEQVNALRAQIADIERDISGRQAAASKSSQFIRERLSQRASLEGRMNGLNATIQAHEGLAFGAKAVLEAAERGLLPKMYKPVGDAIQVDPDYAVAIETALGGAVSDLIVPDEATAKAAIGWLKRERQGRATFQPIPLMRPQTLGGEAQKLKHQKGIIGIASELVDCDRVFRPVIDSLLGRVLVAESLDDAFATLREERRGYSRLVTLDGEVVHTAGSVSGGAHNKRGFGVVQVRAELQRAEDDVQRLNAEIAELEKRSQNTLKEDGRAAEQLKLLRSQLAEADQELREAERFASALQQEFNGMTKERAKLESELADLSAPPEELPERVDIEALETARNEALRRVAASDAHAEQFVARMNEVMAACRRSKGNAEAAQRRLESLQSMISQRGKKIESLDPERLKLRAQIDELGVKAERLEAKRQEKERAIVSLAVKKRDLLERSLSLTERGKELRATIQALNDASHQAELRRARADSKRANSLQRLVEEYGITEDEVMADRTPVELPADAPAMMTSLRKEVKGFGDVNLGAIEAYERVATRCDELRVQREDLRVAMAEIQRSIKELEQLTHERFSRTFASVQVAFATIFKRMFGGGEGQLSLVDADGEDSEAGVDIVVQPPGKRKQNLALLSGGERSLCALAFLFALLEVKSSPLVVLDEVDAPLDGVNVERFAELVKDFSNRIQFIVITHNPTTIASAPMWLGVTMAEPGCSTLIPYRTPPTPVPSPA